MDLSELRVEIDNVDRQMVELLRREWILLQGSLTTR